jgi:hypothetical protein
VGEGSRVGTGIGADAAVVSGSVTVGERGRKAAVGKGLLGGTGRGAGSVVSAMSGIDLRSGLMAVEVGWARSGHLVGLVANSEAS